MLTQIPLATDTVDRILIVVLTTNAGAQELAERVSAPALICTVIAVGSVAGWRRAERAPTPAPIRLRRR